MYIRVDLDPGACLNEKGLESLAMEVFPPPLVSIPIRV
jgi:hypothetical protein